MSKLVTNGNLKAYHAELAEHIKLLQRNTTYALNDIVNYDGITLKCTTAGTTNTTKPNISALTVGSTYTDGTCVWTRVDLDKRGIDYYVASKDYEVDDQVVYNNKIYKCITAHTSTATFDTTKWTEISACGGIDLPEWQANTSYTVGQYLVHEGTVYKVDTDFTSTTTFSDTNLSAYISPIMEGATSSNDGKSGIVPYPQAGDENKFLKGDGTWADLAYSGAGLNVINTVLWSGTQSQITSGAVLNLTGNYTDYDLIEIIVSNNVTAKGYTSFYASDNNAAQIYFNESSATDKVTLMLNFTNSNATVTFREFGSGYTNLNMKIYGIKFLPNPNNYSTTEQEIGTWIDGKPLYQRTLTGTITAINIVIDISGFGIDTVYDVSGIMGDADVMIPLNYYNNGNYTYGLAGYGSSISDKKIYIGFSAGLTSGNYYVTIKYTKV